MLQPVAAPQQSTQRGKPPSARVGDEDEAESLGYLSVDTLRKKRNDYLTNKVAEIEEQREGRHYYHAAHWTASEIETLRRRRQPIITYNRVGRKINGITGLVERQRQDPKAYPRTPKAEEGAEVATATVRYVLDANDWRTRKSSCCLRAACEGIAGVELSLIEGDHGDPDIGIKEVDGENFFYDVRSVRPDFSDDRSHGIAKWLSLDEATELFPDKEDDLKTLVDNGSDLSTNQMTDREHRFAWISGDRLLLVEHWYKYKGRWCWAFYVGTTLLMEGESPFYDERKKSMSRFVMWSAHVDHDGDRYGFVRNLKSAQDEINQRRSKALWMSVARQVVFEKGTIDDAEVLRRELMRPDGTIEINPGKQLNLLDQSKTSDIAAQFQFLQDAKDEIQNFAKVDVVDSVAGGKNLSGRAINMVQQAGMAELGPFVNAFRGWNIRVYRAIWCMAQRHWTAERWIRVTDDEDIAKFLQINGMDVDEYGQPVLVNALGNLDVDIILDEGPDVVNMMADVYDQVANDQSIPFIVKLKMMSIPGSMKREIEKMLQPQPPNPADIAAKQIALEAAKADVEVRHSTATKNRATAVKSVFDAAASAAKAGLDAQQAAQEGYQDAPLQPAGGGGQQVQNNAPVGPQGVPAMPPAPSGVLAPPQQPGVGPHLGPPGGGQSLVPPHLGPRVAPDGKMYVSDPTRPGKYMLVA